MATGSIAPNFHEGARSEYLAQYVFSALGTSITVPRPEDYGIDLFCTLGYRIGQRMHIEDYYCVQVKSNLSDVEYEGKESVAWVTSLSTPLFYCVVDKENSHVDIYSSIGICMLSSKKKLTHITAKFDEVPPEIVEHNGSIQPYAEHKNEEYAQVFLGKPILSFKVTDIHSRQERDRINSVLRSWIRIDQENLDNRAIGYTFYSMPGDYEVNNAPSKETHVVGNFLDSFTSNELGSTHYKSMYKSLSQQINLAANSSDRESFQTLHDAAVQIIKNDTDFSSINSGSASLVSSVLGGAKHLKLDVHNVFQVLCDKNVVIDVRRI